ncbi:restriction endonuclease subunit S [Peptostreptococcus russellii]|uniref:restriction endonuclease subunit S n=1 Tax=Peptostreptococcus russellii TaxID=215200 RepID=UPI0026EF02A8|nr:restriction endonuclease subunit S [Peptostreptococcus russellii]
MSFSEWREVALKDVIEFNPKESIKKGTITKKIGMDKLAPFQRKIDGFELEAFKGGSKFRNGDTLLARITPCLENGKTAQVTILDDDEVAFGSTEYIVLRHKIGITDNNYIFYLALSQYVRDTAIKSMTGTSGRQRAQTDVIENTKIMLPPLDEQKAIAHILSTLDDKIEVNNQIGKTLENMAQAIFKQWFVDFEFPNEEGEPYKSSGGEMVESELGLIPLGWKVHLLKDFVPVITGKKNANVATNSGKYKFFTCSQIASKTDDYSFEGKAILVAGNGDFNVKFYNGKFEAYQRTYVLIPHKEDLSGFIYYMMDYNLEEIVTNARGSVISYLTKGDLEDSKIAFPEKENHIQYTVIFQIINEFILNLNKENEKLSELRDTLLPKLMSGEIRVPLDSEGDVS